MRDGKKELRIGLVLTGIILGLALLSLFYTPYNYNAMDKTARSLAPSLKHLFGTDSYGRDIFSRAIFGSRYTLLVALSTVGSCTVIASVLGLVSGYVGGILDEVIMRIIDAISSFPDILIALMVVTVLNLGQFTIVVALCITFVPSFTRIVRTATLQYKNEEFVKNLRVFGVSDFREDGGWLWRCGQFHLRPSRNLFNCERWPQLVQKQASRARSVRHGGWACGKP